MDNTAKEPTAKNVDQEEYPLLFNIPVGMSSRYAHHMMVQVSENDVTLSFFEIIPPLVVGTQEQQKEAAKKGLRADCVARVTFSKARYADFLRAMTIEDSKVSGL